MAVIRLSSLLLSIVTATRFVCETLGFHGIPTGLLHHPPNPAFVKADEEEEAELASMKLHKKDTKATLDSPVAFAVDHNTEEVTIGHKVSFGGFPNFELPSEKAEAEPFL
uniref:Uncharacterized protein n=1 Tax=Helicotheca tamesis TaxID=374047 RepID=A0A7S2GV95_9STRA|mmetsp:Transcript_1241/g.1775  ORF Transcript_1241/g.1775 Transcript_1241/m.1775 type:complete len:110 (+) Transcript_1241:100-429(+)|eukprot:CAMPEP_0185728624 /NCGR_PEP_ID=MMETSP1171-20130828/3961_1 /TAXON_ID=374046 /ORGANISM="Helicotheca tamensis, Strain CCMP826" /LENGTH=109 /DNA_ID=CAMNT_0028397349 /DNA_START=68 /DNA_END=397 /DNA_ORIENTATION=-